MCSAVIIGVVVAVLIVLFFCNKKECFEDGVRWTPKMDGVLRAFRTDGVRWTPRMGSETQCQSVNNPTGCPPIPMLPLCDGFDDIVGWLNCFLNSQTDVSTLYTSLQFLPSKNPFGDGSPVNPLFHLIMGMVYKPNPHRTGGYELTSSICTSSDCKMLQGGRFDDSISVCRFDSKNLSRASLVDILIRFFKSNDVLSQTTGWVIPQYYGINPKGQLCQWTCSIPGSQKGWTFDEIRKALAKELVDRDYYYN